MVKLNGELGNSLSAKILDNLPRGARNPIGIAPMEAGSIPASTTHNDESIDEQGNPNAAFNSEGGSVLFVVVMRLCARDEANKFLFQPLK